MGEGRPRHGPFQDRVVDPVQLQGEEQEACRGIRDLLLGVAVELGPPGGGCIARIDETGEGNDSPHEVFQRLVALQHLEKRLAGLRPGGHFGQLPAIGFGEGERIGKGAPKVCGKLRRIHARVKVRQVPFGKMP